MRSIDPVSSGKVLLARRSQPTRCTGDQGAETFFKKMLQEAREWPGRYARASLTRISVLSEACNR